VTTRQTVAQVAVPHEHLEDLRPHTDRYQLTTNGRTSVLFSP